MLYTLKYTCIVALHYIYIDATVVHWVTLYLFNFIVVLLRFYDIFEAEAYA